jgi:diguanylate cyclase (GGDEF)-like protein
MADYARIVQPAPAADGAAGESGAPQASREDAQDSAAQLEQALRRIEQQDKVLAFFEQKWLAAQNDVQILMDSHVRMKERLNRLTEHARKLYRMAISDELTGLPNRRLLIDRLQHAIVQAERNKKKVGVVCLGFQDMGELAAQHGPELLDQVMQQLARRLEGCVRGGDTVGRYGVGRFVIVLPEVQRPRNLETVLQKLRVKLASPFVVENRIIRLGADFGVAIFPADGRRPQDLIRHAEAGLPTRRFDADASRLPAP